MKSAAAIRHVPFEDLGTFEAVLAANGYACRYIDAGVDDIAASGVEDADLLIVLGGPIGVYEEHNYPFLTDELALIRRRLAAGCPILGICLGAQLIAGALGSRVFPTGLKEIGWGPIELNQAGLESPLRHLEGLEVLHWHGDTFDMPVGCELLASTHMCRNQAFARGANLLALQFHPEVDFGRIEQWLIGHACELGTAGIDPVRIREGTRSAGASLERAARRLLVEWLERLG